MKGESPVGKVVNIAEHEMGTPFHSQYRKMALLLVDPS